MRYLFTIMLIFLVSAKPLLGQGILKNYDSRSTKYAMVCYTNQTGWVNVEIVDNKIWFYISGRPEYVLISEKDESRGLFAAFMPGGVLGSKGTIVVDYKNKKVTQNSYSSGVEVFRCK